MRKEYFQRLNCLTYFISMKYQQINNVSTMSFWSPYTQYLSLDIWFQYALLHVNFNCTIIHIINSITFELCVISYFDYMSLWFSRRIMQFVFCHLNIGAYLDNAFHYILWSAGFNTSNKENRWKCWHHPLKKFIFLKLKLLRNIMNMFEVSLWPWKVWD